MKTDQNTQLDSIDILKEPNTETLVFRYILASSYCKGKDVLDCASGNCYGSQILNALGANSVFALDIDSKMISEAKNRWDNNKVNYMEGDLCVPWVDSELKDMFDTTVSIETFEHLPKDKIQIYLNNMKDSTKNGGKIFITTPQRQNTTWKYNGGTHLYEYSVEEFAFELDKCFGNNFYLFGIQEMRMGDIGQLVSIIKNNPRESHIMCALIEVKK